MSREAARKKVEGLRLQKQTGNDGKVRVIVDLDEVQHRPLKKRRPREDRGGDRAETARVITALEAHVTTLQDMLAKAEAVAARERERADGATEKADEAAERARLAEADAAYVPALKDTVAALKGALESEKARVADLRAERDRALARRSWWPFRRAG